MKIVAFIQMHNEVIKGNLIRCLENCKLWADDIVIYDDGSTDTSVEVARRYTQHVLIGKENKVIEELAHKQMLLEYTLKNLQPDWIMWIDCDEILDRRLTNGGLREMAKTAKPEVDAFSFHELNLWRGENWQRKDTLFDKGWFVRLWRCRYASKVGVDKNSELTFNVQEGVHKRLYPITIKTIIPSTCEVIHYGFHDYRKMMVKIGAHLFNQAELEKCAETNWILDERKCECVLVPDEMFPEANVPKSISPRPLPRTLSELKTFPSLAEEMLDSDWATWWSQRPDYFTSMAFGFSRPGLIGSLGLGRFSKICELGFGYGRELTQFCMMSDDVTGFDLNPNFIEITKKNIAEQVPDVGDRTVADLKLYNGVCLPTEKKFDLIYSCFVMQHNSKLQGFRLMVDCLKHLTPDGKILFEFFGAPHCVAGRDNDYYSVAKDHKMYNNAWTEDELKLMVTQLNDFVPCELAWIDKQKVGYAGKPTFDNYWVCIRLKSNSMSAEGKLGNQRNSK